MITAADLYRHRRIAEHAARLAGRELRRRLGNPGRVDHKSAPTDPVSDADRASEALIVTELRRHRPDDGILAEEGSTQPSGSGLRWVIDPLDGTVNYLYGIPFFSVSIACEQHTPTGWQPLVGTVYDPMHDELFHATRGAGAWLNEQPLARRAPTGLHDAILATGLAYRHHHRTRQGVLINKLAAQARDLRMLGSTALALCWVAAGRCDGYLEDHAERWDLAAGSLIAEEAGAIVESFGAGVLAAAPHLADELKFHLPAT
ncbi:inositol monophosphatase family protein [Micromonospora sediminicola]|uniref:inositol monophosphatase family protein n=1 Tax=Micromonospora sediminicola TaxID=946078 RepID=UPI0033E31408